MKKAVLLFASPNKKGNTIKLYEHFKENFNLDITVINIYDCIVAPCIDCKVCFNEDCPFNQDDMGKIIKEIRNSSIIICATPIYFNGVPAPFKSVIDRCQQFFIKTVIQNKPVFNEKRMGILLTTAGSDDNKVTSAIYDVFKMFFNCFNADFIEHIAVTNLDDEQEYNIDQLKTQNIISLIENLNMEEK